MALDATDRVRPDGERLEDLVSRARSELGAPLMADVDTLANGLRAAALGCDWVGTTLFGYTEATSLVTAGLGFDSAPAQRCQQPPP